MNGKYYAAWYGGSGSHKTWGVYRNDGTLGQTLICVCAFKKGAENAAAELNTLVRLRGEIIHE